MLKDLRQRAQLSQQALADIAEVDRSMIYRMEAGETQPTLTTLFKLAEALQVQPHQITMKIENLHSLDEPVDKVEVRKLTIQHNKQLGEIITKLREKHGLSQQILAERAKLDRTYISLLERGKRQPTFGSLMKLARALSVRPSEILRKWEKKHWQ